MRTTNLKNSGFSFAERALQEKGLIQINPILITKKNIISPFELCDDNIDYHPCSRCFFRFSPAVILGKTNPCHSPYISDSMMDINYEPEIATDPPDCYVATIIHGCFTRVSEKILFHQSKGPSLKAVRLAKKFKNKQ